jgi:hypothetical protein
MPEPLDYLSTAELIQMYTRWSTPDLSHLLTSYLTAIVYNQKRAEALRAVLAARGQGPGQISVDGAIGLFALGVVVGVTFLVFVLEHWIIVR